MQQKITKIIIGCDHAALDMKLVIAEYIRNKNIIVEDKGTHTNSSCDYPDYAHSVCEAVLQDQSSLGVLICGSGVGISIAANKVNGIRCGLSHDYYSAQCARTKDHCNVIAFGARVIGIEIAKQIVDVFISSQPIYEEQYLKRIELIRKLEKQQQEQSIQKQL